MKTLVTVVTAGVALMAGTMAFAQPREVAGNLEGGLTWAVATDVNAAWRLECGFRAIAIRGVPQNRMVREGVGPQTGRLPTDNGRCTLTRVSGEGNIGLAVIKNGTAIKGGSTGVQPAKVNIF